jgi:type VI secretion system Hcp family effector
MPGETAKHTITSPRDPASGQATGKRQHKPVRITKEWGAATPMLAIAIDEPGVQVTLKVTKTRSNIQNN